MCVLSDWGGRECVCECLRVRMSECVCECLRVRMRECVLLYLRGRECECGCLRVSGSESVLFDLGVVCESVLVCVSCRSGEGKIVRVSA